MQGTVENCISYATVYGSSYVGGIIGTRDNAMGNCSVIGCKFYGTVEASSEVAGGIAGGGYDNSTAPNGCKITINSCSAEEASPVLTRSEESLVETSMWHRLGITALIPLRTIPLQERYRQQRQTQHM